MIFPTILSTKVVGDRTSLIEFSQNEFKKYDISNLLSKPMFVPQDKSTMRLIWAFI